MQRAKAQVASLYKSDFIITFKNHIQIQVNKAKTLLICILVPSRHKKAFKFNSIQNKKYKIDPN